MSAAKVVELIAESPIGDARDVQSAEVVVARRALSLFVRMVDAERLVIWYHEPALVENARLQCVPRGGSYFALVSVAEPPRCRCLAFGPLVSLALTKSRLRSSRIGRDGCG